MLLGFVALYLLDLTTGTAGVVSEGFQPATPTTAHAYENLGASLRRPWAAVVYMVSMLALLVPHQRAELALDMAACIGCGACVAACPYGAAHLFVGSKLAHLSLLPTGRQERGKRTRSMLAEMEQDFGTCSLYGECAVVCPSGIPLTAIAAVNKEGLRSFFRGNDD